MRGDLSPKGQGPPNSNGVDKGPSEREGCRDGRTWDVKGQVRGGR